MPAQSDLNSFKVFIWAESEVVFKTCASLISEVPTVWIDSNYLSRADALVCAKTNPSTGGEQGILFLDADCEVSHLKQTLQHFKTLIDFRQVHPFLNSKFVVCGQYKNPLLATRLQRAHNLIANSWLNLKFTNSNPVLLGGAIFISAATFSNFQVGSKCPVKWGAEDAWLAQVFKENGFELIKDSRFKVTHHTSKLLSHFIRRAFLHGQNQNASEASQALPFENVFKYLKRESDFYSLIPEILLHFVVLKLGILSRRFLPKHKWPQQVQNQKALV